jgi:transcriptional regulator with XRE-family HTH domain
MTQTTLGEKLRMLRAQRGLTLTQAAEVTHTTRDTLAALESGKRKARIDTLFRIAEGYGVDPEELDPQYILLHRPQPRPQGELKIDKEMRALAQGVMIGVLPTLRILSKHEWPEDKIFELVSDMVANVIQNRARQAYHEGYEEGRKAAEQSRYLDEPPPQDVGTDESMTGDPSEDPYEVEPNPLFKNDA